MNKQKIKLYIQKQKREFYEIRWQITVTVLLIILYILLDYLPIGTQKVLLIIATPIVLIASVSLVMPRKLSSSEDNSVNTDDKAIK